MDRTVQEQLTEILDALNWNYEILSEISLVSGFQGEAASFTFFLFTSEDWLVLTAYCNLLPIPEEQAAGLALQLAHLNFENTWVKYGLDDKNQIVLSIELPVSAISQAVIDRMLQTAGFHIEEIYTQFAQFHQAESSE